MMELLDMENKLKEYKLKYSFVFSCALMSGKKNHLDRANELYFNMNELERRIAIQKGKVPA